MSIKPPPRTYSCPKCGWSKMVMPKSDALGFGDIFDCCPKCGNEHLVTRASRFIKGLLTSSSKK
jgi:predicted RNA-binding Zn-ribbon protein involved in translation (DUF1610 family)